VAKRFKKKRLQIDRSGATREGGNGIAGSSQGKPEEGDAQSLERSLKKNTPDAKTLGGGREKRA